MANINSLTSSNSYSSSIYGSRNVISGLASGMDTEAMIENSVSGYKTKIAQLQQQIESITWKQDAFRSITDKLIAISEKYTSYNSKTNLSSNAFFTKAVSTFTNGTYASLISATGKCSSDVKITSVKSLATAAKYTVGADKMTFSKNAMNTVGKAIDWTAEQEVSNIAGSTMTVNVGETSLKLSFGADDIYDTPEDMVEGINKKLEELKVTMGGESVKGSDVLEATLDGNTIVFNAKGNYSKSSAYISGVTGKLKSDFGVKASASYDKDRFENNSFTIEQDLSEKKSVVKYLDGKSISVEYNGVSRSISLTDFAKAAEEENWGDDELTGKLAEYLQDRVNSQFGAGRVTVGVKDGALSFGVAENSGSTLKVTSSAGEALGIGGGLSNYFNTSKTLGDLLGENYFNDVDENGEAVGTKAFVINGVKIGEFGKDATVESVLSAINNNTEAGVKASFSSLTSKFVFTTTQTGADQEIEFGDGLASKLFGTDNSPESIKLGDLFGDSIIWDADGNAEVGVYVQGQLQSRIKTPINQNDTLDDLISKMKDDTGFLPTLSQVIQYDETTGQYSLAANGASYPEELAKNIVFGQLDGAGKGISLTELRDAANTNSNFTRGQDAELTAVINGEEVTIKRESNTIQMDGLSVTLKGTFEAKNEEDAVTFETHADADNIVDIIRTFVDEYNAILKEIHDAYSTQPLTNSSGNKYSPLTDDDKSGMSDTAIANYEEKAKTGLLFGDSDLSSLYGRLWDIFSSSALSEIGLDTTYSNNLTQITLDEDKLREALENDPDKVKDLFTQSKQYGADSDGLMTKMKNVLDTYASKSVATPGILVKKAGTALSSVSLQNNTMQKQIEDIQKQIDKWQTKLSSKIDYYTRQFTALETLMSTMNNQSSMLMSMMGGG